MTKTSIRPSHMLAQIIRTLQPNERRYNIPAILDETITLHGLVDLTDVNLTDVIARHHKRTCLTCDQTITLAAGSQTRYVHDNDADIPAGVDDHQAVPKLAHPMDLDPFAGLDN